MAAAPQRSRPGADSPFKLQVDVEPVRTPAAIVPEPEPEPAPVDSSAPAPTAIASSPAIEPTPQPAPEPTPEPVPAFDEPDRKTAVTVQIRSSLRLRAQTAVLRTAGLPGGHRSFAALVESALVRELERLESTFNEGEQFQRNVGAFRTGRPFAD